MLRQILQHLEQGGLHTTAELAAWLGTSEELAGQMLEDLARRGYLASIESNGTACDACPVRGVCEVVSNNHKGRRGLRLWQYCLR